MYNPRSTYRIQFHHEYQFHDLTHIIPYLDELGVGTLYASPIFQSQPGSQHGYDITDLARINSSIGSLEEFLKLQNVLKRHHIGWLQDIVPNHMAFSSENPMLFDVLEHGQQSEFAHWFDILWEHPAPHLKGKLLVPFLGLDTEKAAENGELKIKLTEKGLLMTYYQSYWPLNPSSYRFIMQHLQAPGELPAVLQVLAGDIKQHIEQTEKPYAPHFKDHKARLYKYYISDERAFSFLQRQIKQVNEDPVLLLELLDRQHYRLAFWRDSEKEINYRRFFTINGLVCLRQEDRQVFEQTHAFIKEMVDAKVFQGVRVDHIDGLHDPARYLQWLRETLGAETWLVAEKILEDEEELPLQWPVQGTSGYDFLAQVNNLLTWADGEEDFSSFYHRSLPRHPGKPEDLIYNSKTFILTHRMNGELNNLMFQLEQHDLLPADTRRGFSREELREALAQLLICCPVYRLYSSKLPVSRHEKALFEKMFAEARKRVPRLEKPLNAIKSLFSGEIHHQAPGQERAAAFFRRFMQFTGPVMAKGVEDTVFYMYNRFVSHNEVGDSPLHYGISAQEFHERMQYRQRHWPLTMNATSTHDTKRGEDARARLNVISEFYKEWEQSVQQWSRLNQHLKKEQKGEEMPSANDEYFLYQTLLAILPMDGQSTQEFAGRVKDYMIKAVREGKVHSNWSSPDQAYEDATLNFIDLILAPESEFLQHFKPLWHKIRDYGVVNSLVQTLLKMTCPGVPDVYQGTELWDFSLVDPDNRRPVDYEKRRASLYELQHMQRDVKEGFASELWKSREDGRLKLWLTRQCLHERRYNGEAFEYGEYQPLQAAGKQQQHVFAFARSYQEDRYVVVTPRHLGRMQKKKELNWKEVDWKGTVVELPELFPGKWLNLLTGEIHEVKGSLPVADVLGSFPVALLKSIAAGTGRSAGVLMHLTSLPTEFGTGDTGPQAFKFADFLESAGQQYWQVLPLAPVNRGSHYSPYSSESAFAGNTLLLSPEELYRRELLSEEEMNSLKLPASQEANFEKVEETRQPLYTVVADRALQQLHLRAGLQEFEEQEKYWLEDYATFRAVKQHYQEKCWWEWPEALKTREPVAMAGIKQQLQQQIQREKMLQFLFFRQWERLKRYCNIRNIKMVGDMPFYVSHDSADVWAHSRLFKINAEGQPLAIAGVPPDYFSETGQLWGMPVFNWQKLKQEGYEWWLQRIGRNMAFFDMLRLDHFRAFSDYWEVPADEETAINGQWQPGPGNDFFDQLKARFPDMPFIAEDLGDIDQPVYALRDRYQLPGMFVLQFAFGTDTGRNMHAPHLHRPNSLVYTGTHDNNTSKGWFASDLDKRARKRLEAYLGKHITKDNVHMEMVRMAYGSVAKTVIVPLQDIIGIGQKGMMNRPSTTDGNWRWRLKSSELKREAGERLRNLVRVFGRY